MPDVPEGRRSYDGVVITTPITVPYARFSPRPAQWWIGQALRSLCRQAGIPKSELDGFAVASFTLPPDSVAGLTQHFGISPRWLEGVLLGGASSLVMLRRAARAVQAGDASIVACIAADTNNPDTHRRLVASFSRFAQDAAYPYGAGGPNASFALLADHYMRTYGATREDFGKLCVAQRENAFANPLALLRKPLSLADYLNARVISSPIHLYDCPMPCAGAEAFLVMSEKFARAARLPAARILALIERHNAFPDDAVQIRGGWAQDRDALWAAAGIRPDEVDFMQSYDDYPVISMMQFEDLGFCRKGEGPDFVRQHDFTVRGSFPHNTSGGQLSVGQAGAAGGGLGLGEAVRQLTGSTLGDRVANAATGLVCGFGMINYDRGLCSAAAVFGRA